MHDAAQLPDTIQAELAPDLSPHEIHALEEAVFAEEPRTSPLSPPKTAPRTIIFAAAGLGMRAPSAALTGWVTTRMLAEAACVAGAGKGGCTPPLAPSAWPGGLPGPATRLAGASHLPPAAAQLHVDLTLKERLAALTARREERDKTFLALRRRYVHELRCFLLERQEQDDALLACAAEVRAARAAPPLAAVSSTPSGSVSPGGNASATESQDTPTGGVSRRSSRRAAAASQEEPAEEGEDADVSMGGAGGGQQQRAQPAVPSIVKAAGAVDDDVLDADPLKMTERAHASAIAAQNVQLRARLSLLTKRLTAEWKDALVAGAVRPPAGPGDESGQGKALAAAHAAAITAACPPQGESGAAGVHRPSSSFYSLDNGLVFASGDIVRCDLGDGLVVGQNDVTGMCCVRLTWGAVVFCPSDQLLLLALAGEDSTTPRRLAHGAAVDKQASLRGGQYGFGGSMLDGAHGGPGDSMHARDDDNALAAQLTAQVQAAPEGSEEDASLADVPCAGEHSLTNDVRDARKPVFRISWDARVPRGVPLRLNPARGLACNGYATGAATRTFDGAGDAGMPGAAYGVSWHPADADVFLADGGRARRGQKAATAGPASGSSFALGEPSSGGFSLVPVPEGGLPGHSREEGVSTPAQQRSALGGLDDDGPPALANVGGNPGGIGAATGEDASGQSPLPPHAWGAMSPMTPGGGVSATATKAHMAQSRAEVQRLKYQLRTAEEARRDQRRRLTDSRQSVTFLLGQLSRARAALSAQSEDLTRREGQVAELAGQVERMTHRYSEAVRRAWVVAHPEDAAATPDSEDSGADDEEDDDDDEEEEGGLRTEDDAGGSDEEEEGASMDGRGRNADDAAADAMAALAGAAGAAFGGRKRSREDEDDAGAATDDDDAVQQLATMAAALQGSTTLGGGGSTPVDSASASDVEGGFIAPMAVAPTDYRPGDNGALSALSPAEFAAEVGHRAEDGRTRSLRLRLQGADTASSLPHKVQVLPLNAACRMYQHKTDKAVEEAIRKLPLPASVQGEEADGGAQAQGEDAAGGAQSREESVDGGAAGSTSTREEPERRGGSRRRRRSAR